jgi:hypothetical protein
VGLARGDHGQRPDARLAVDAGPMAIGDQPSLLREAGRPGSRTALARQWSTRPDYIQAGERSAAHTPAGTGLS